MGDAIVITLSKRKESGYVSANRSEVNIQTYSTFIRLHTGGLALNNGLERWNWGVGTHLSTLQDLLTIKMLKMYDMQ